MLLLFGLGVVGWLIASKIKIPVPSLMGSIIIIGFMNILGVSLPDTPKTIVDIAKIVIGYCVGAKVNTYLIKNIKALINVCIITMIWSIVLVIGLGWLLYGITSVDINTAILSSAMGGLTEIIVMSTEIQSRTDIVIAVQLLRVIITIVLFPLIISRILVKRVRGNNAELVIKNNNNKDIRVGIVLKTIMVVFAGALLFESVNIPAGYMIGAMITTAIASAKGIKILNPSKKLFNWASLVAGIYIANSLTRDLLSNLNAVAVQIIVISTVVIFISSIIMSFIIYRVTKWDYVECFMAMAPAGFTTITLLSQELGGDTLKITTIHMARLLALNITLPFLLLISNNILY